MRAAALLLALVAVGCTKEPRPGVAVVRDAGAKPPLFGGDPAIDGRPRDPLAVAGEQIFIKYCALCHGVEGRGYAADNAPSLVSDSFLASATDEFLTAGIRDGRPGSSMAGYGKARGGPLDDGEIRRILVFLREHTPTRISLEPRATKGDPKRGAAIYEGTCKVCHGDPAARSVAVHLANPAFLAAASDEFLRYAIVNGRAGTKMVPMAGLQLDDQQLDDLVALLRSWAGPVVPEPPPPPPPPHPKDTTIVLNPKGQAPTFTMKEDRYVPAEEVKDALAAKRRLVIIDARAASDWSQVHIPGALSVPYYQLELLDELPAALKADTWILAYCACPHHASGVVVDELRTRGFAHTAVIDEGISFWQQHGFPITGAAADKMKPP